MTHRNKPKIHWKLQLYYNPNIPDDWSKTLTDHGTVSCDISSLVNLQQWKDSVTIVVNPVTKKNIAPRSVKMIF